MTDLRRLELMVDRRDDPTSPEHGMIELDELNTIWEDKCKDVPFEAIEMSPQPVSQSPSMVPQFANSYGPVGEIVLRNQTRVRNLSTWRALMK